MTRIIALCAFLLSLPLAQAGPKKPKCAEESGGTKYEIVRGKDGKRIFRIKTGFCIEGKVPKPNVIYVLNSSSINYEWENLKQDFLPKIQKPVEKKPF